MTNPALPAHDYNPDRVRPERTAWPPCPAWCTEEHPRDLDSPHDAACWALLHTAQVGADPVKVEIFEHVVFTYAGQIVEVERGICCPGHEWPGHERLTVDQANALGINLVTATMTLAGVE